MTSPGHRLASFSLGDAPPRAGVLAGEEIYAAAGTNVLSIIESGAEWETMGEPVPLSKVRLHAPLLYPGTIYCAGANYADHVAEMARAQNMPPPPDPRTLGLKPWFFIKPARSCVVGPGAIVARPRGCQKLDWEAELVAVIGKPARDVPVGRALEYVAGYMIANDLSARDLARRTQLPPGSPFHFDWSAHKGFEGSCPLGPWITPAAAVRDPQRLAIRLWVNGALKQDSNTSEMIYSVAEQISHLSALATLHPGDIILTGTPAGVGTPRNEFLQPGDQVAIEIEGLGRLENRIS
jgi:2-keto-4-pentenoate hydratase/2-oxohepta-3-ene-1,7-dioic acid hydratase in catechol pathway